ncbi:MAG: hypothetical protein NZ826_03155, partial [Thermodesulfovibrio sp.]|nr:hypothetical protein [Thermodesulfovibrio sp.]
MLQWDWNKGERLIFDINEYRKNFSNINDLIISPDGEKLAFLIVREDKRVIPCINGKTWNSFFDRVCYLNFLPNNSLACLVLSNYEWTMAVDEKLLEETFDYAWNLQISKDASTI